MLGQTRRRRLPTMLTLSDGLRARNFPIVNVSLIVANFAVWLANFGLYSATANGGGAAFFAHAGVFIFGVIVATTLLNVGRVQPQDYDALAGAPA